MRVVEDVEKFDTEIERVILSNYGPLRYSEIGVVDPGPWKNRRLAVPKVPRTQF